MDMGQGVWHSSRLGGWAALPHLAQVAVLVGALMLISLALKCFLAGTLIGRDCDCQTDVLTNSLDGNGRSSSLVQPGHFHWHACKGDVPIDPCASGSSTPCVSGRSTREIVRASEGDSAWALVPCCRLCKSCIGYMGRYRCCIDWCVVIQ
jgi:hypothetical protein